MVTFPRCIVIHGCEETVFRTFLYYLYGGTLDTGTMSTDDIIEVMAIADRYETTSLRGMCEDLLVERVKDGNVFELLQVADHYSARWLRVREGRERERRGGSWWTGWKTSEGSRTGFQLCLNAWLP